MASYKSKIAVLRALELDGRLTPLGVLDAAASPDSPLHDEFDWNNDSAAHKYRISQARSLIRSVQVVITTQMHELRAPLYVRDPDSDPQSQGYISVDVARDEGVGIDVMEIEKRRIVGNIERSRSVAIRLGRQVEFDQWLEMYVAGVPQSDSSSADGDESRLN